MFEIITCHWQKCRTHCKKNSMFYYEGKHFCNVHCFNRYAQELSQTREFPHNIVRSVNFADRFLG